jgi:hypothetical protein
MKQREAGMKATIVIFLLVFLFMRILSSSEVIVDLSHPANAMWIEPTTEYFSSQAYVGTRFNVTVWMNVTQPTSAWQFLLIYDRTLLQALRCGYTGDKKSEWSGGESVTTVSPVFASGNSSYSYVLDGETLNSRASLTGAGSLGWVEFNITYVPSEGISTSEIRLDQSLNGFSSYAVDADYNVIQPFTFGNCDYSIFRGAPIPSSGYIVRADLQLLIPLGIVVAFAVVTGACLVIIMVADADRTRRRRRGNDRHGGF